MPNRAKDWAVFWNIDQFKFIYKQGYYVSEIARKLSSFSGKSGLPNKL